MLMPVPATFIRPVPVWSSAVGSAATEGEGFPAGTITLTARTITRQLVYLHQIGNITFRLSSLTIGGVVPTLRAQVDGWYIYTMTVSTSGTALAVSGTGGGGRSVWYAYELSGYLNAAPVIVQSSASAVSSFSAQTSTNMAAAGLFEEYPAVGSTITSNVGTAPAVITTYLDIGYYMNWTQANTRRGPATYSMTAPSRYLYAAWR